MLLRHGRGMAIVSEVQTELCVVQSQLLCLTFLLVARPVQQANGAGLHGDASCLHSVLPRIVQGACKASSAAYSAVQLSPVYLFIISAVKVSQLAHKSRMYEAI